MAEKTAIEWCDHTFNPWWGCAQISPGCDHCYAKGMAARFGKAKWGKGETRAVRLPGDTYWNLPIKWNEKAKKSGRRARVFCGSMMDICEQPDQAKNPDGLIAARDQLFDLIPETPWLDWLLLTKRPSGFPATNLWKNVWFGISAENQTWLERRLFWGPSISGARGRMFLSAEPLLGALDLTGRHKSFQWIIVGGENGPLGAREMKPEWVYAIRDFCIENDTPFFFKGWGSFYKRTNPMHYKNYGDTLNGIEWKQFPEKAS